MSANPLIMPSRVRNFPTPFSNNAGRVPAEIPSGAAAAVRRGRARRPLAGANRPGKKQTGVGNVRGVLKKPQDLAPWRAEHRTAAISLPPPAPRNYKTKILIVDDDASLTDETSNALRRQGFSTATATSGRVAIDWLARNRADLMLLNLNLHDIESRELISHVESIGCTVPFIIITDQSDERVAVEMIKRGALDYRVKNTQFLELVPTIVRRALTQIDNERRLAFAEKQARLAGTVLEQNPNAALITERNGSNPDILYVNPAFADLFMCSVEQVVAKGLADLEALTGKWHLFRHALLTDNPIQGEMRLHTFDGKPMVVDCTIMKIFADNRAHTHWAVILPDIAHRKQLEREIIEIADREQSRIGRDLHDGLGQQLTALELFAASLKNEIRARAPELSSSLEKICEQLREAIRQTRGLATGLSPISVHGEGLPTALRRLATSVRTMARVDCEFIGKELQKLADVGTSTQLYRVAQEAVTNALKHGRAKKIRIALGATEHELELRVTDNGRGFLMSKPKGSGLGLRAMAYRADLIGATLNIHSTRKKGTEVICTVPKQL